MLTRCPHCQTAFRVISEQLKVRQGRVRCGACQNVFDALDSLVDELPVMPQPEPKESAESAEFVQPESPVASERLADLSPMPETAVEPEVQSEREKPEPEPEAETRTSPQLETETHPVAEAQPAREVQSESPGQAVESVTTEAEDEAWMAGETMAEETPLVRRWPWLIGALLLLLIAAGQLLFIFRVELGVLAPELRPALAAACEAAGCTLPYPSKSELVGIETSDLVPAATDRLLLTATIKNRAPFIQEYPHLELTLTDTRDEPMLRKVLAPAEYLPTGLQAQGGFPARGEVGVKLQLEAQGVPAVGYRLYLFYP